MARGKPRRGLAIVVVLAGVSLSALSAGAAPAVAADAATVQAACDAAQVLLDQGYIADAETKLKASLVPSTTNPCAAQLLGKVLAAKAGKQTTPYFNDQVQVVRALLGAGFESEARTQAQALIESNPNRPIPPDIRGLTQRLGWWRFFLGDVGPLIRTALEILIGSLIVLVALLLVAKGYRVLYARAFTPSYTVRSVTGLGADDVAKQTALLSAELALLAGGPSGGAPIRRVSSQEEVFSLPDAVTSAFPESKLLAALISLLDRLLPRNLTEVNAEVLPIDPVRGAGITVQIAARNGRRADEATFWERDFYPKAKTLDADAADRIEPLMLPAAVWLAYNPKLSSGSRPRLNSDNWQSYAHFAVGERAQRDGDTTAARRAYAKALDFDETNVAALLSLAGLKLYREKPDPAAFPTEEDRRRLSFAHWLLDVARQLVSPGSSSELRLLYLRAVEALSSDRPAEARAIATELYKLLDPHWSERDTPTPVWAAPTPADAELRAQLSRSMRLPTWIVLHIALLGERTKAGRDLGDLERSLLDKVNPAWWQPNSLYNLACFYARKAAISGAPSDLSTAESRLREAIDRADEPELLANMAECDPSLSNVVLAPAVVAELTGKPGAPDYSSDIQTGHRWGVRVREAVTAFATNGHRAST